MTFDSVEPGGVSALSALLRVVSLSVRLLRQGSARPTREIGAYPATHRDRASDDLPAGDSESKVRVPMNRELAIVLFLLAATTVMFALNRPRMDAVALIMMTMLPLTGVDHGLGGARGPE